MQDFLNINIDFSMQILYNSKCQERKTLKSRTYINERRSDMKNVVKSVERGEIYYADLNPVIGSEQGGIRPVLIVQNDMGNRYSPTTIVIALSTKYKKTTLPTHVPLHKEQCDGLPYDSVILCEQMRTIDKRRIKDKIGNINHESLDSVMKAIKVSISMF